MKRRNFLNLLLVALGHVAALSPSLPHSLQGQSSIILHAEKSKMPVFSADDEEALKRMSEQFGNFGDQRRPSKKAPRSSEYDGADTDFHGFQSQTPPRRRSPKTDQPLPSPSAVTDTTQDLSSELMKLAELKNSGVLTEKEFSAAKAKLLGLVTMPSVSGGNSDNDYEYDVSIDNNVFEENISFKRKNSVYDGPESPKMQEPVSVVQTTKKTISTPNKDWRTKNTIKEKLLQPSVSTPDKNSMRNIRNSFADQRAPPVVVKKKIENNYDYDSPWAQADRENPNNEIDFGYDDFESAMAEEMGRGMFSAEDESQRSRGKYVQEKIARPGLNAGDMLPTPLWECLVDANGATVDISKLEKGRENELLVTYVDPRRMTEETRLVIDEMKKLPQKELKLSVTVVNCDDHNDHRKFLKKNKGINFPLLSDPQKKFVESIKCKCKGSLASALFIIDVSNGMILRIWYENDFDPFAANDLVLDEIKNYRKDPDGFLRRQLGRR